MMAYDFKSFAVILSETNKKMLKEYQKYVGIDLKKTASMEELPFYKNYLSRFDVKNIQVQYPKYITTEVDWTLLFQLITGSFTSKWAFELSQDKGTIRLRIDIYSGDQHIRRYWDELLDIEIAGLYNIYLKEMIEKDISYFKESSGKYFVKIQRNSNVDKFEDMLLKYRLMQVFLVKEDAYNGKTPK